MGSNSVGTSAGAVPSEGAGTGHFLQPRWGNQPWGDGSLEDRFKVAEPLIEGPAVLDIGCASRYGKPDWVHGLIEGAFPEVVGIDIDQGTVERLQAEQHDVRLADARDFDLGQKFDTVFAGELIEHLDDVRGFLTSVRNQLTPGGRLVLTTPSVSTSSETGLATESMS